MSLRMGFAKMGVSGSESRIFRQENSMAFKEMDLVGQSPSKNAQISLNI